MAEYEDPGFRVGDIVEFYCEPRTASVRDVRQYMVSVELPWRTPDSSAPRPWSGKVDFPLDPEEVEMNSPWRIDPELEDLVPGGVCIVGIPSVRAKIVSIRAFNLESDYAYTPRPSLVVGAVPTDWADVEEAGFTVHIGGADEVGVIAIR